jgi:putative CocE/NonD family hydrolase
MAAEPSPDPAVTVETATMRTRDGVRLVASVWRPAAGGPHPVLLMRQPYGRAIASTVTYAHPAWYARHGYVVVIQDVRGRGESEGTFDMLAQELADGTDTLDWAARLPGTTGAVGMYGFSYQGMTQLFAAASRHPALKAIAPAMLGWDLHGDVAYENGAFRLGGVLGWAIQLGVEHARRAGDAAAHQALFAASRHPSFVGAVPAWPDVMERHGARCHYPGWLDHPAPGPFWDRISPRAVMAGVDLPMLHIGGWFDGMLTGTLGCWRAMAGAAAPQLLRIGPWVHIPWARKVGDVDFGPAADSDMDLLQLRWFDHWLKGIDSGLRHEPAVRLFEMTVGAPGAWRDFAAWPAPAPRPLYLASAGRAGLAPDDGALADEPSAAGSDVLVMDPWRPTPSLGGHAGHPGGPLERGAIDSRADVATYTTPPLAQDLRLAGDVVAEIFCAADQPSHDLSLVLSDVAPDGRVLPLLQAHARLEAPSTAAPAHVPMRALCARIAAGHSLRLSVAAAAFPAYELNPGTGARGRAARAIDQRVTTLTILHGAATASRVLLPVTA